MSNKMLYLATFAIGAAIGSVATWQITKKKFEQQVQEEISSVKEAFERAYAEESHCDEASVEVEENDSVVCEECESDEKEYKSITDLYAPNKKTESISNHVFTISPEEFAENDEYQVVCLSYFEDDRLADIEGNLVDINTTVGHAALTQFGEYEDDVVHVRNTLLKTDYEILLEPKTYSEAYPDRIE